MTRINSLYKDLILAKELIYDKCGFDFTEFGGNTESAEYGACCFRLNGRRIQYRVSKITPKKAGQFVTIWKRNKNGITEPFDMSDGIDFIIISSRSGDHVGQFIFPVTILADKGIITRNADEGKRGLRVYPPWTIVTNKQAEKTQAWQTEYFITIRTDNSTDLDLAKTLLINLTNKE
jgi:hypothetical protein